MIRYHLQSATLLVAAIGLSPGSRASAEWIAGVAVVIIGLVLVCGPWDGVKESEEKEGK